MEVKEIFVKNFVKVREVSVNVKPGVTYLMGENGSGKTVIGLDALWFVFKGLAQKGKDVFHGERFRFIGPFGKSATGKITLHDEKEGIDIIIKRKMTKDATKLDITASDGRQLDESFIDDIFSIFLINPWGFVKLAPKAQALALGIDTSALDERRKALYDERTVINREVTRLQGVVDSAGSPEKAERVNVQDLMAERTKSEMKNKNMLIAFNEEKNQKFQEVLLFNQEQDRIREQNINLRELIRVKEEEWATLKQKIDMLKSDLDELPIPGPVKDTDIKMTPPVLVDTAPISAQIAFVTETNEKAIIYENFTRGIKSLKEETASSDNVNDEINALDMEKAEYVKAQKLPFSNMSIDEDGGLLVDGRPFSDTLFSKGEIGRMVPRLMASQHPKLKFMFVPDSQSIDEPNRKALFEGLSKQGFQVMAEYVGTVKRTDHPAIMLRQGEVVESYEEDEGEGL